MLWRAEGIRVFIIHGIRELTSKELKGESVTFLFKCLFVWRARAFREECKKETKGWPNAVFKKFGVEKEAWDYVKQNCHNMKLSAGSSPVKRLEEDLTTGPSSSKVALIERLQKLENLIQESHENVMLELNSIKAEFLSPPPTSSRKISLIDLEDAPTPSILQARSSTVKTAVNPAKKIRLENVTKDGNSSTFKVDEDGCVVVYTDGACTKNGFSGAKAGIGVWFGDGHILNISEPVKGRITNNSAEIEAATAAIEAAHVAGVKKLKVYTDSSFLISAITCWIKKWRKNGWKTADGESVKNKEELILLSQARNLLDVTFVHVKGHSGNYANDKADALARAGAAKCPLTKMH